MEGQYRGREPVRGESPQLQRGQYRGREPVWGQEQI